MAVHYPEIVSNDVDTLTALYQQGQRGTFAIVIQGDVQHGLWQR